jgi:hypothetical protein
MIIIDVYNNEDILISVDDYDLISQYSHDNLHLIEGTYALTILEVISMKAIP